MLAINHRCPRSGRPVAADSLCEYRGATVGFCNPGCRDDFAADPQRSPGDRAYFDALIAERDANPFEQPRLDSERLVLRPHRADDADALFAIFSSDDVVRYWSRPAMTDRAEAVAQLARVMRGDDGFLQWAVERREDGELIGTATLFQIHPAQRRAEIGYALRRDAWGHGYAREAVARMMRHGEQALGLLRFEADVDPDNLRSLALLAALGFRREGYAHRRWRSLGEPRDSVLLARVLDSPAATDAGVIDIAGRFAAIDDCWNPRIAAELNGQHVRLARLAGEFVWHSHAHEDEMFLVVSGRLRMRFRDRDAVLLPGQFIVVPRGTEHLPVAEPECEVLLFEPAATVNTGALDNERTRRDLQRI